MDKPYLFKKLTLDNFMMHHQTAIELSDYPITLITGANGTGKTQILDALILVLGYHPKRLRKGKLSDLVGVWGKQSQISLHLYNPQQSDRRMILTPDKIISPYLDTTDLEIQVELTSGNTLEYYLASSIGRKHITRKDVRDLFESLHVQADNKLAFTEEGTVNIFADHSSKNKLDLLLETTGLTGYRDNLLAALDAVEKALQAVEPLKRKMVMEREYLENMEKARHLMSKKSELIKKQQLLLIEEAWSHATQIQQEVNTVKQQIEEKQAEIKTKQDIAQQTEDNRDKVSENLRKIGIERDTRQQKWEREKARLRNLDGQNQSNQRMLEKKKNKLQETQKKREQILQNSGEYAIKLQQLQQVIADIKQEKEHLQNVRQHLNPILFRPEFSGQCQRIQHALEYEEKARSRNIIFYGPILAILLKSPNFSRDQLQSWLDLLGPYLLTFIFDNAEQFRLAQELFTELWGNNLPAIFLALDKEAPKFPAESEQKIIPLEKKSKRKNKVTLLDQAEQFPQQPSGQLEAMPHKNSLHTAAYYQKIVWHFIEQIAQWRIVEGEEILNLHDQHTCFYQGKIYLPWPGVGGCPSSEFWKAAKEVAWEDWPIALQISIRARELDEKESKAQHELRELQAIPQLDYLDEQIAELQEEIQSLADEIKTNQEEYEQLAILAEQSQQAYQKIASESEDMLQNIAILDQQLRQQRALLLSGTQYISALEKQQEQLQTKLDIALNEATSKGKQPKEIRTIKNIQSERAYLEGQLANLQVTVLSEEEYETQKARVLKLENEVVGSDTHLAKLKTDMTKRFENWHQEVVAQISGISAIMNRLMNFMVQGVQLRIENLRDPKLAGLQIEVRRHSQKWLDLAQLSGGEKVLTVEAMILALHFLTDSPLHAIDECTQRLDLQFKAQSFDMVRQAVLDLGNRSTSPFAPQFILLAPDTLGVEFPENDSCFRRIILAPSKFAKSGKKQPTGGSVNIIADTTQHNNLF